MPRPNPKTYLLYKWQKQLGESCFTPQDGYMYCSFCSTLVTANRRSQLVNHLGTRRHQNALAESTSLDLPFSSALLETQEASPSLPLPPPLCAINEDSFGESISVGELEFGNLFESSDQFNLDLCQALREAGIPLSVLNNGYFSNFLAKYTQHLIPNERYVQIKYKIKQ